MRDKTFDGANRAAATQVATCASDVELRTLRGMLDCAFAFIGLLAPDGTLLDANHAAVEGLGLRRVDVIGKQVWDTYYWSHARASREMMRDAVERAALGETVRGDFVARVGDETFIVIDAAFAPMRGPDGAVAQIVASAVDVTQRVMHAEVARKVRHQLETAQRIAKIGSWHWEFTSGALTWSDQCYRLVGLDPTKVRATLELFMATVHPQDRALVEGAIRSAVEEGMAVDFEHRVVLPTGEARILHQLGEVEFDVNERPARMIGTSRDVTDLRNTCEELVEAKLRAEAASQTKSRFLANMSHELRTPLNAIIGFSEVLLTRSDLPQDKQREYLADVCASGRHLLSVINDILDISRIEAGKVDMREETVKAEDLIDSTQRLVRTRAEDAGIDLHWRADDGLLLNVDRRLMMQVVLNFASNAVKFTESGGRVDICAARNAQSGVDIVVRDTGIGMSADDVERVGERFLQADGRLSRKYEGTGLGLVIAKRLIELHGGELIVQSKPGAGTTMTTRLPAARVSALAAAS